ncbi:amidohydrolase family protein [Pseudonocardia sp. C8]|nr:amidohydrolase family protein [Pseudonocardia sp. C8]
MLTAGQVIVAPDQPVLPRGAVLVTSDGRIGDVGPEAAMAERHQGTRRLEFPAATVLPGLINAHVHLAFEATADPVAALRRGDHATVRGTIAAHARTLLDAGVTTVRDLGDRDGLVGEFRDQVAAGTAVGPRVLSAYAPLTSPQGHCWFLGGEVSGVSAVRAAVHEQADRGADLIKLMAGGGRLTPLAAPVWESQFSLEELRAAVETAHGRGLRVAAHAHGTDTMALCAEAGVDTIEHGGWLTGPTAEPRCYEPREDIADLIADRGIAVCPTRFRNWRSWPPEAGLDGLMKRLAWMRSRGIALIAGTDAGVGNGKYDDLVEALGLYVAAGWSPSEALALATTRGSAALGRESDVGRVAQGCTADLLVVDGDPLADLEALRAVQCVVAGGRLHHPHPVDPSSRRADLPGCC